MGTQVGWHTEFWKPWALSRLLRISLLALVFQCWLSQLIWFPAAGAGHVDMGLAMGYSEVVLCSDRGQVTV